MRKILFVEAASCVAVEDTICQSTVQHIPAQISRPSQTGLRDYFSGGDTVWHRQPLL